MKAFVQCRHRTISNLCVLSFFLFLYHSFFFLPSCPFSLLKSFCIHIFTQHKSGNRRLLYRADVMLPSSTLPGTKTCFGYLLKYIYQACWHMISMATHISYFSSQRTSPQKICRFTLSNPFLLKERLPFIFPVLWK